MKINHLLQMNLIYYKT